MRILLILLISAVMGPGFAAEKAKIKTSDPAKVDFPLWKGEKATLIGDVLDLEGKTKLFTYARYGSLSTGDTSVYNVFYDLENKILVVETSNFIGGKLKSYMVDHRQRSQTAKVELKDKRVHFTKKVGDKETTTDSESLKENFVVGMTLIPYIYQNWETLMKGDSIKMRFGVWSRLETVGFKLWKEEDKGDHIVIVMKPTSFVIRAIVDPLFFSFDKKTKEIVQIKGRTTPSIKKDGKWEELDATIKYRPGPAYQLPKLRI